MIQANNKSIKTHSGQAMIALIFIISIVMFWAVESSILNLSTATGSTESILGQDLLIKAESYLENAIMQYLRDPTYSQEELQDGQVLCTIEVTGIGYNKTISSTCRKDNRSRSVFVTSGLQNGVFSFSKIMER